MDPKSLKVFEISHRDLESEAEPNQFNEGHRLRDLSSETLFMVLRPKHDFDQDVVGKLEPNNDVSTKFGTEMTTRLLKPVFRRLPDGPGGEPREWYSQNTSVGFIDNVRPEDKIFAINTNVSGGRRRKTRRRMIKKRRRTRSKRPSKA
jgi:hypothetical protein